MVPGAWAAGLCSSGGLRSTDLGAVPLAVSPAKPVPQFSAGLGLVGLSGWFGFWLTAWSDLVVGLPTIHRRSDSSTGDGNPLDRDIMIDYAGT
jgi:hypothetical protein